MPQRHRSDNLTTAQQGRLERFAATRAVDIHCHCLPGMDDGPQTLAEAVSLCRMLAADGITCVAATPHELGRYDGCNGPAEIRRAVAALNDALATEQIPLDVVAGADVRVDERLVALVEADQVMTLGDAGKYILLELPHQTFIDLGPMIRQLASVGVTAILSHPERHSMLARCPQMIAGWLEEGSAVQVTAGSVVGDFGPAAEGAAWHWLASGWPVLVATDAHGAYMRIPRMSAAIEAIGRRLGHLAARRTCVENPDLVLREEELLTQWNGVGVGERR